MMMRIDDRQLRFEDRLLLLFCEPRIVGFAAMTKPAWLNGLRHGDVPIFADIARISGVRDGHRLAFDVRSKALTRDSRVHATRSDAPPGGSTGQEIPRGGPAVRIPLAPAQSLRTTGSSARAMRSRAPALTRDCRAAA